ncbi:MAG: esterase-like activity of phytase family protein [Rhodobacteraceae bacterium]|jgi:hypothetical protein|nr:esterase-like activity of phytase family protein [Paracoccaceae bacterium]
MIATYPGRLAATVSLIATLAVVSGDAAAQGAVVLDRLVMPETRLDGQKIGEFSALVRTQDGAIVAVSDRGYMAHLDVVTTGDRLARVEVRALHLLTGPDGTPLRDGDFSPEAAAVLPDGALAIVDETGPRLAAFDLSGRWLRDEALPEPVRDATLQASDKDGVEALAWTEATGFLAMTEEPAMGDPRDLHRLHSGLAGSRPLDLSASEAVSIKGMETDGPRLILLERTRDNSTDALHPFLRVIDVAACLSGNDCTGTAVPVVVDGITDADFEGLAALGDDRFLMVSDDKVDGDLRSVFVLVHLP